MKLYGMLDSPYVRRLAISLDYYGVAFEHYPLSVFSTFDEYARINPAVKAPTLVLDSGVTLMESSLILDYFEQLAAPERKLMAQGAAQRADELQLLGFALAACEKTVQIVYEHHLRPPEKLHQPWVERVTTQLLGAYAELEKRVAALPVNDGVLTQADITTAVVWSFTQFMLGHVVKAADFPALQQKAARMEELSAFQNYPLQ